VTWSRPIRYAAPLAKDSRCNPVNYGGASSSRFSAARLPRGRLPRARSRSACGASACSTPLAADDAESQARHGAFLQGLQESGWSIGRNVKIDYRGARRRRRSRAVEGQEDHARLDAHLQMKRANLPKPNVGRKRR